MRYFGLLLLSGKSSLECKEIETDNYLLIFSNVKK